MKRDDLFREYVEKHIDYKKIVNELIIVDYKVFIIKNEDLIYNYTRFSDFISEIKISMVLFGLKEVYLCEDISDKPLKDKEWTYTSGSTFGGRFNYI